MPAVAIIEIVRTGEMNGSNPLSASSSLVSPEPSVGPPASGLLSSKSLEFSLLFFEDELVQKDITNIKVFNIENKNKKLSL